MMTLIKSSPLYVVDEEQPIEREGTENNIIGYIALYRGIRNHWIWNDPLKFQWWVDILMECNHADRKADIGFELIDCKRGQSLHSLLQWSKRWRVDISTVRRFFKMLQSDNMVFIEPMAKTTRLTVCNYDSYQPKRHAEQRLSNVDAMSTQCQDNTNNNDNNDKNVNNKKGDKPSPIVLVKPNKELLTDYFTEIGMDDFTAQAQAVKFLDYYESNGWKVGRNKMKDWKAAARNWKSNQDKYSKNGSNKNYPVKTGVGRTIDFD